MTPPKKRKAAPLVWRPRVSQIGPLRQLARQRGQSLAELLCEALDLLLARERRRKARQP